MLPGLCCGLVFRNGRRSFARWHSIHVFCGNMPFEVKLCYLGCAVALFSEMATGVYPGGTVFHVVGAEGQWDARHQKH